MKNKQNPIAMSLAEAQELLPEIPSDAEIEEFRQAAKRWLRRRDGLPEDTDYHFGSNTLLPGYGERKAKKRATKRRGTDGA